MELGARPPHQQAQKKPSRLYNLSPYEPPCEHEEHLEHAMTLLLANLKTDVTPDATCHQKIVDLSENMHDDVTFGLLYLILTASPHQANVYWGHLSVVVKDGLRNVALTLTNIVFNERFTKLLDGPFGQILFVLREGIKCDFFIGDLLLLLMRQVPSGDTTPRSLKLAETITEILQENLVWVKRNPYNVIPHIVYNYLRWLTEHHAAKPKTESLYRKELELVTVLLNEHFTECLPIGRDLGRLLIMVARIPGIDLIWQQILTNPQKLSPQLTDPIQLFSARPSRRYILSRITPDMERKFHVFLTSIKFGNKKKYQEMLTKSFLASPEQDFLRADLTRYICAVIHPSNEILASDVTPRWAVIGWLLTGCQDPSARMAIKLALFWDWFFFDPARDSIMNIEPAILLIHNYVTQGQHSQQQATLAKSLLDYLCRSMLELGPTPALKERVKTGVKASLANILEKRVLVSLSPIFDMTRADKDLRGLMTSCLGDFFGVGSNAPPIPVGSTAPPFVTVPVPQPAGLPPVINIEPPNHTDPGDTNGEIMIIDEEQTTNGKPNRSDGLYDAEFSSEEDEVEFGGPNQTVQRASSSKPNGPSSSRVDASFGQFAQRPGRPKPEPDSLLSLSPSLRVCLEDCKRVKDDPQKCSMAIQKLLIALLGGSSPPEPDTIEALAPHLVSVLEAEFEITPIFPAEPTQSKLEESVSGSLSAIFRNVCLTPDNAPESRTPLLQLLAQMSHYEPRLGYRLLYFLRVSGNFSNEKVYKSFCRLANRDLEEGLIEDLSGAAVDDFRLFGYLIPDIFVHFASVALASVELMRLVVGNIDSIQLQDLISQIILEWETIEQYFLWQLFAAADLGLDWIIPILSKLEYPKHAEALSNALLTIRRLEAAPNLQLLKHVLGRPLPEDMSSPEASNDHFTSSVLVLLVEVDEEKLIEMLSTLISKAAAAEGAGGSKKAGRTTLVPLSNILGHLDMFRKHCKDVQSVFDKPNLESALRDAYKSCTEGMKLRFGDLFGVMEALTSVRGGRNLRRGRKVLPEKVESDEEKSEGEYSDDEESGRRSSSRSVAKKRPRYVESDSD